MKIIISPAKKMRVSDELPFLTEPLFLERSSELLSYLRALYYDDLKQLLSASDKITREVHELYQRMDTPSGQTPAILGYDGIQYTYMAPQVFDEQQLEYINSHLRILSGFYGLLRPFDGIRSYRLEMQAKVRIGEFSSLYEFWGDSLYRELTADDSQILNLASDEYAKCIRRYVKSPVRFHECRFCFKEKGRLVEKGVWCKMARGEMVRYMAEEGVEDVEGVKGFNRLGFRYCEEDSAGDVSVFVR